MIPLKKTKSEFQETLLRPEPSSGRNIPTRKLKSHFVISPLSDLLVFGMPLLVSVPLLISAIPSPQLPDTMLFVYLVTVPVDGVHILASLFAVSDRFFRKKINILTIISLLALIPVLCALVAWRSHSFLLSFVSTCALIHVCQQQFGWMMLCCSKSGDPIDHRGWDKLAIWNMMLFPILYWLSSYSSIEKSYFNRFDLQYVSSYINHSMLNVVLAAHVVFLLAYVVRACAIYRKSKIINATKIYLLLATWIWFWGGLVLFKSHDFFFRTLILSHSLSYMVFVYKTSLSKKIEARSAWARPIGYIITLQVLGAMWFATGKFFDALPGFNPHIVAAVMTSPVLIHIIFDSFIWRRSFFSSSSIES